MPAIVTTDRQRPSKGPGVSPARRLKETLRRIAYHSGVLAACHHSVNRNRLTTVMFHRVLSPRDPRWAGADPEYTLSDALFAEALAFLARHYSIVSLDDLFGSLEGRALPPCPLLITFDDGWADNADYALAALRKQGAPAVIFVAADAIDRQEAFWQERLYAAWRTGARTTGDLRRQAPSLPPTSTAGPDDNSEAALRDCIAALGRLPAAERDALVEQGAPAWAGPAHMATAGQLRLLASNGVAIGAHGASHAPLTEVDAKSELERARARLLSCLQGRGAAIDALSFPHGRYDAATIEAARECGYRLLFTSDPVLTPLAPGRRLDSPVLGRIDIPERAIIGRDGDFSPDRMASWLFLREPRRLTG